MLKPAEETPLSALIFEQVLAEAGVPDGVVNLVNGWGHTAGQALIEHPDVDKIAFTGSTEVGKKIVQAAAGNLKRVMLELGGKSPVLIYDDADLERGDPRRRDGDLHALRAGLRRRLAGVRAARRLRPGRRRHRRARRQASIRRPDRRQPAHSGPIISERQMNRVLGYIDNGKTDGAEVVVGGHRLDRPGWFVHPTVLAERRVGHARLPGGDLRPGGRGHAVRR